MDVSYEFSEEATLELHRAECYFKLVNRENDFFLDLIDQLRMILKMPEAFQVRYDSVRVVLLKRFNYSIHYRIKDNGNIIIYRILNQSQEF